MKKLTFILTALVITLLSFAQDNPEITVKEIYEHIRFLASDSLKGRKPGTPEGKVAAEYIRDQFISYGMIPMGDNGFQFFEVIAGANPGDENTLTYKDFTGMDFTGKVGEDFIPLSFSASGDFKGEIVFSGYGLEVETDSVSWNDYDGLDVTGKWVMILRGSPSDENNDSDFDEFTGERSKVLTAKDNGALGVLFVTSEKDNKEDNLMELYFDKSTATAGIPVISIKRSLADMILSEKDQSIGELENYMLDKRKSISVEISGTMEVSTDIVIEKVKTQNVIAFIEGNDPVLKNEYVVVGAHYDHLGFGGPGSGSRVPDTTAVHYGADDNASGVTALLELAEKFAAQKEKIKRRLIFIAFGAEEMGLLGSKYFVENPLVDLNQIKAMINIDMVGRLKPEHTLLIGGTGTSDKAEEILDDISQNTKLNLKYSPEGYGPSDHASFYIKNIPVFFVSTGAHSDYHTPADNIKKIDPEGEKLTLDFVCLLISELLNRENNLIFREAGPKGRSSKGFQYKVTLGIMPDFASGSNDGLYVDDVRKGGPADNGGMKKGDKIVAINGKPVGNIYDYMARLKKLSAGQTITVDIIRDGKTEVLLIQL